MPGNAYNWAKKCYPLTITMTLEQVTALKDAGKITESEFNEITGGNS